MDKSTYSLKSFAFEGTTNTGTFGTQLLVKFWTER